MVKETKIVFDLGDMAMIRLRCVKCNGEASHQWDTKKDIPSECPWCGIQWMPSVPGREPALKRLTAALRDVASQDYCGIRLRFEINVDADATNPGS